MIWDVRLEGGCDEGCSHSCRGDWGRVLTSGAIGRPISLNDKGDDGNDDENVIRVA